MSNMPWKRVLRFVAEAAVLIAPYVFSHMDAKESEEAMREIAREEIKKNG